MATTHFVIDGYEMTDIRKPVQLVRHHVKRLPPEEGVAPSIRLNMDLLRVSSLYLTNAEAFKQKLREFYEAEGLKVRDSLTSHFDEDPAFGAGFESVDVLSESFVVIETWRTAMKIAADFCEYEKLRDQSMWRLGDYIASLLYTKGMIIRFSMSRHG
jgi:hypothetical protein